MHKLLITKLFIARLSLTTASMAFLLLLSDNAELFGRTGAPEIKIEASFAEKEVATNDHIELRLNRPRPNRVSVAK